MEDNLEGLSDSELNDIIYNSDNSNDSVDTITDSGVDNTSDSDPVSPAISETNETTQSTATETDDDHSDTPIEEEEKVTQPDSENEDEASEKETSTEEDTDTQEESKNEDDIKDPESDFELRPLKANGKEYPIESVDELYKLASAGVGAQKKFQAIAPYRKSILAAEKAEVDLMESVNLMANLKEDPQGTILRLMQESNIDPMALSLEDAPKEAQPKDFGVSDFEVKYGEIVGEIGDTPLFQEVQNVIVNQWDEASREVFLNQPELIKSLYDEMTPIEGSDKSLYELSQPIAEKMKLSGDTRSDIEIYMDARTKKIAEIVEFEETAEKKSTSKNADIPKKIKDKKIKSSPTNGSPTNTQSLDFASMSDSELDEFILRNT